MKHELVAVVDITFRIDWLEVTCTDYFGIPGLNRDRLYPMEGILKLEEVGGS